MSYKPYSGPSTDPDHEKYFERLFGPGWKDRGSVNCKTRYVNRTVVRPAPDQSSFMNHSQVGSWWPDQSFVLQSKKSGQDQGRGEREPGCRACRAGSTKSKNMLK